MITIRKANERGLTKNDWLKSQHTFSFGRYQDPIHTGLGVLQVINEDIVQPNKGFGLHEHHDMEIISYVIQGVLEHKDSMGTHASIHPGEIQRMSAGMGIHHSEWNPSSSEIVHFLQIWISPHSSGLKPSYEQITLDTTKKNELLLAAAPIKKENTLLIHQDMNIYVGYFTQTKSIEHCFEAKRIGWLQMIKGQLFINNQLVMAGDGAQITNENFAIIECPNDAEFLFFDFKS